MATLKAFLRTTKKDGVANIRFRLSDGRKIQVFHKSEIAIPVSLWDNSRQEVKAKVAYNVSEKIRISKEITARKELLLDIYNNLTEEERTTLTSEKLDYAVAIRLSGPQPTDKDSFFNLFDKFITTSAFSTCRVKNYKVLYRALERYELVRSLTSRSFRMSFDIDSGILDDIRDFLRSEHETCREYPEVYAAIPEYRQPKPRSENTIIGLMTKLRTFFSWSKKRGYTKNDPFVNWKISNCIYGTPYYITLEERNRIYHTNLSRHPQLATQRDIFIFQCLIGCRIGDLYAMRQNNIIDGAVEYIPRKTKDGRPVTVRVPLNSIAIEIIEKYRTTRPSDPLFPFISQQHYNKAIKRIFLSAKITRPVTILNPLTREAEIRPLNEIASSHLARRTFVGNLYKKVKDPNLVGALSGHVDGSRAFARYREIDEEMKRDLVKLLE